jgi:hypothetical protein
MTMRESEKSKRVPQAEAELRDVDPSEFDDADERNESESEHDDADDESETPIQAVWLSLAIIVIAGLYGLYLGTAAKSQSKSVAAATSSYAVPMRTGAARTASLDAVSRGRLS